MSKSLRLSDELTQMAAKEACLMTRSLANQVEHWARLGCALEKAGVTLDTIRTFMDTGHEADLVMRVAKEQGQRQSFRQIRTGKVRADQAFAFSESMGRRVQIDI